MKLKFNRIYIYPNFSGCDINEVTTRKMFKIMQFPDYLHIFSSTHHKVSEQKLRNILSRVESAFLKKGK